MTRNTPGHSRDKEPFVAIRPDCVVAAAAVVVTATAPPDAVGFHVTGMRNASQFLAMACEELQMGGLTTW